MLIKQPPKHNGRAVRLSCDLCLRSVELHADAPYKHICGVDGQEFAYYPEDWEVRKHTFKQQRPERLKPGWGDRVQTALEGAGITQDRWIAFKEAFGGAPTCNCEKRKRWLNDVGDKLGRAARDAIEVLYA